MAPDEEADVRRRILHAQEMAAYHERKGNSTGRHDDASWSYEQTREYAADVKALQSRLEAAGLPCEPHCGIWDFRRP